MGFAFFLLFLAGIAFVLLQGRQMGQLGGGGAELTGINWRPVTVGGETIPEDSGMFILFEIDGSIKGNAGCNTFFGSLEQSKTGLGVGPLGTSRKACAEVIMSREATFLDAVQKTADLESGRDSMSLLDDNGSILARFVIGGND